jgi:hypothetical protein
MTRQLGALTVLLTLAASALPVFGETIASTFDSDVDGWTVNHDGVGPTWMLGTGGNGFIEGQDDPVGATWWFVAPGKFLGDKSAFYDGIFSFRLRQSNDNPSLSPDADVLLHGKVDGTDVNLVADILDRGYYWRTFTLSLTGGSSSPWHIATIEGALASESDVRAVLATLSSLWIKGENANGYDWARLDDVILQTAAAPGDANRDGRVDQADYVIWYSHYGASGGWSEGDFTSDGLVDQADNTIWYNNYGVGSSGVPEPATLSLLALGGLAILRRRV